MSSSEYLGNLFSIWKSTMATEKRLLLLSERFKFTEWADSILKSTSSNVLDSIRIRCYLRKEEFACPIDELLSVAISKKVLNYDINLSHFDCWGNSYIPGEELYEFPCWLFTQETMLLLKSLSLNSCVFKPLGSNCYTSLLKLQLDDVLVDENNLISFLSKCPNLEKLCLSRCSKVFKLEICGSLHKLKHLTLMRCGSLDSIEIDAKNLMRVDFEGYKAKIFFRNCPRLSIVTLKYLKIKNLSAMLQEFSSNVPKLESLMLSLPPITENIIPTQFVNLTKLELMINTSRDGQPLWSYIPLIQLAPNLLKLEMNWIYASPASGSFVEPQPFDPPLRCLEDIKLTGFTGTNHEIEFARYLITNANALTLITVSCNVMFYSNGKWNSYIGFYGTEEQGRNKIMEAKQQLMDVVPSGTQLQFI